MHFTWASLVAQLVKNVPAMQEIWVRSLVGKIPLEKGKDPFQYSGLENSMNCIVQRAAKIGMQLSDFRFLITTLDYWKNHSFDYMNLLSAK